MNYYRLCPIRYDFFLLTPFRDRRNGPNEPACRIVFYAPALLFRIALV